MRNKTHLHYGSLVSLRLYQSGDCYLTSDGFIQKSVIAQDYSSTGDGARNLDFLDSVFQVLPLYQYQFQQDIQRQLDQFYKEETQKFQQDINSREDGNYNKKQNETPKIESNFENQEKQLINLSQDLNRELMQNDIKFNKNKNLNISYGEKFQLQHFRSKKYLCLSNLTYEDGIQNTFSLQLENNPSEKTFFKFVSAYKHQPDLSKDVQFDAHVFLAIDIEKEGYIYYLNQDPQKVKQVKQKELEKVQEMTFLKERKSDFYFKFIKQTIFELKLYCECIEDDKNTSTQEDISTLIYGDIVWITENQSESYLECVDTIEDEMIKGTQLPNKYPSLSQYAAATNKDDYDQKQKILLQIQQKNNIFLSLLFKKIQSSELKNTRGLWKIEAPQMDRGGPISLKSEIRLKNIRNGLYLAFVQENTSKDEEIKPNSLFNDFYEMQRNENKQKKQKYGLVEMHLHDSLDYSATLFQLVRKDDSAATSSNNEFLYEYLYDLRHVQTQLYLGQMYKKDFNQQLDVYANTFYKQPTSALNIPLNNTQKGSSNFLQTNYNQQQQQKSDQSSIMSSSFIGENMVKVKQEEEIENPDDYQKKVLAAVVTLQEPDNKEFIKLYKAPHEDVWEILFLLSCIPQLQKGINLLKYVQETIVNSLTDIFDNVNIARKIKQEGDGLEKQFLQFNRLIQSIIQFCYEKSSLQTNQAKEGKFKCNIKRQRLLREQGVLRYLTLAVKHVFDDNSKYFKHALLNEKFLNELFKNYEDNDKTDLKLNSKLDLKMNQFPTLDILNNEQEKQQIKSKVTKIFKGLTKISRSCYQLIYQICNQNFENQMQAFKYIKVYQNHIGFNLGAENCIIAILQENEDLLLTQNFTDIMKMPDDLEIEQNQIKNSQMLLEDSQEDTLLFAKKHLNRQKEAQVNEENKLINIIFKQYKQVCQIDKAQRGQQYQILDLLSCLCKNEQEGLTINQSSICDMIFTDHKIKGMYNCTFVKIIPNGNHIFVENLIHQNSDHLELLEFFQRKPTEKDSYALVNYQKFVQKLIQLYANLCQGRNYNCIEKIRKVLPFISIQNYLWNQRESDILSSLISIADCVYIDKKPQYQRFVPDLVHSIKFQISQHSRSYIQNLEDEPSQQLSKKQNQRHIHFDQQEIEMVNQPQQEDENEGMMPMQIQMKLDEEEKHIRSYLKHNVFDILTQYLVKCRQSNEIRNQPLTLNTIELTRKFLVFDMFSLTSKQKQNDIYQLFLTILRLELDEQIQSTEQVQSIQQNALQDQKGLLNKKQVHFSPNIKQNTTTKSRISKTRAPRKSVNDTLQRENLSILHRRQIQNPNDDPRNSNSNEKSQRQTNIDLKKKVAEIFLIYIDLKINHHITQIIQHIRLSNQKKKSVSEEAIHKHMRDYQTIFQIFPKIELPLPTPLIVDRNNPPQKIEIPQSKKDIEEDRFPPLNYFLKDQTFLNTEFDSLIQSKSEQLLLSFLNIFLYNNDYQLNCLILNLIFKNSSIGKQTIKVSKNLVIISDEEENKIDIRIDKIIKEFSFMCETSETWFVHASKLKLLENQEWVNQNPEEKKILLQKKEEVNKSIQQIKNLNELMFTQSVQESLIPNLRKQQNANRQVKMNRQFMMKNVNAQKLIMDMLKDNIHILEEITEYDSKCQITKVFTNCFLFLKNFCLKDNKINKKDLYNDIKFFIRFMKYVEVGQTELINEIYKDNYKACTEVDDDIIRLYLAKICHPFSSKGYGGRHLRYLQFIQNIMFFKKLKMPITNNIWKVTQNIQITMNSERMLKFLFMKKNDYYDRTRNVSDSTQYYTGLYIFDLEMPQSVVMQVTEFLNDYTFEDEFTFNQPYIYHVNLLNLIIDIIKETEGRSTFLKNTMRRYLPCDYILFFLQKMDYFLQTDSNKNKLILYLKKPLCHLLLLLYADQESLQNYQKQILENKSTEIFLNNEIKKMELQNQKETYLPQDNPPSIFLPQINIKNNNSNFDFSIRQQRNSNNTNDKIKFKARNEGLEEYGKKIEDQELIYENRLYETLVKTLDQSEYDHVQWFVGYSLPVINFIFEICQKVNSNKFLEQQKKLQKQLSQYNLEEKTKNNTNFKNGNTEQILQETKKYILRNESSSSVRTQTSRFKQGNQLFLQRTTLGFEDDLEQYVSLPLQNILSSKGNSFNEDKYPKIFLLNMLIMDEIKDMIDLEKRSFIKAVQNIDQAYCGTFTNVTNSNTSSNNNNNNNNKLVSRIFPRFTWFLKIAFNQYSLNKGWGEYRIMVDIMRMLVTLLDNPLNEQETINLNNTKEFGIDREQFIENAISEKRRAYQDLFADHNLPKYLMEMLCNKEIDYKLHHQSIKLRRVIFSLLNSLLLDGNRKVQNQIYTFFTSNTHSQVFFDMISDMIDQDIKQTLNVSIYDDIEQDLEGIEFVYRSKDKFMGITDIIKTIQLLCEGHFTKNQNYIRQQTNSRNSINLIEKMTELFDVVIRNHTEPDQLNIDIISLLKANQILDTLIESIQGPVLENQSELIQSKILKSISDILIQYYIKNTSASQQISNFVKIERENIEIFEKNNVKAKGKSKLSTKQKVKNIKMHDHKRQIQEKLIENLSSLSRRFSEKVSERFFKKNEHWMISKLKNKCVQFLDSLLEGNQDSFILNKIMAEIPLHTLSENLGIVYGKLKKLGKQDFSEQLLKLSYIDIEEIAEKKTENQRERCGLIIDTGFRVYHLLVLYHQENQKNHLKHYTPQKVQVNDEQENSINEGYEYFKKYTLHIEINIESKFYVIHFPKLPACTIDYSQIISKYEEKFERVSTKSKTRDLLKQSSNIIIEFQHEYEINYNENENLFDEEDEPDDEIDLLKVTRQVYDKFYNTLNFFKKKIIKSSYSIQTYSFRLAMFQNIVILLSFKSFHNFFTLQYGLAQQSTQDDFHDDQDSTPIKDLSFIGVSFNPVDFFVQFLSVIQICQVILNFFVFIALAFRDFPYYVKKINMEYANINFEDKDIGNKNFVISILQSVLGKQFKQPYLLYLKIKSFILAKTADLIFIFCAIFSLLNPVVTAGLLFDVFRRIPSLKNVLKSLDIAKFQLVLTLILFIVLTYIFALLVYYFFWDNLTNECNSLWICFLYLFDKTFKDNAGYVSGFDDVFVDNWKIGVLDVQQLLYTFIIVIIIGEIISGIIIDTLANLREDDAEKKQDMETICFICGQNRDYLDRKPGGWAQHVNQDHNPMHYIFFIMYLRFKKQTDLSGFESVIKQQVDKKEISWFPIMDFIAEQDGLEEKQIIEKKKQGLKTLEDQVHIDYKEQNEKSIKEKAITILEVLAKKLETLQQKFNQLEDSDSDDDEFY